MPADRGRAGEGDLVDARVAEQGLAGHRAGPVTTLSTRRARPASLQQSRPCSSALSGVSSAGLCTTVLPATRAGAIFEVTGSAGS